MNSHHYGNYSHIASHVKTSVWKPELTGSTFLIRFSDILPFLPDCCPGSFLALPPLNLNSYPGMPLPSVFQMGILRTGAHGALTFLSTENCNQGSVELSYCGRQKSFQVIERRKVSLLKDLITLHVQMVGYPMTSGKGRLALLG